LSESTHALFTDRQFEILTMVADGLDYYHIRIRLSMEGATTEPEEVDREMAEIRRVLAAVDDTHAVTIASLRGLIH